MASPLPIRTNQLQCFVDALFDGGPKIYEANSTFNSEAAVFHEARELIAHIDIQRKSGVTFFHLAAYYPDVRGMPHRRHISLNPEKCAGHTWRESIDGWGLIHVQITFLEGAAPKFQISANSESRARKWEATFPELSSPNMWDWKQIEYHKRRLIRTAKRCT